ncbi:hypothetical protein Lal_00030045 [Lupinus albus]|nr:hypothetical protein Lal_00030045 [Lupinus albus]
MVNLHLRQNPRVDEGFSLKRDTCRSSDVEAVSTTKMVGFSLKRDPWRSSETPRSSEIQGHFWAPTIASISANLNSVPVLNGTNFEDWIENMEIVLGCMDLDYALRVEQPPPPLESSTSEERKDYEKWECSNRALRADHEWSTLILSGFPLAERTENHQALATGTSYNPHTSEHSEWLTKVCVFFFTMKPIGVFFGPD